MDDNQELIDFLEEQHRNDSFYSTSEVEPVIPKSKEQLAFEQLGRLGYVWSGESGQWVGGL